MAQSLNTNVEFASTAISYLSSISGNYGKILMGDKAFEFFNDRNVEDYIQIPWEEVKYVEGQVFFGKLGRQFIFQTTAGRFRFSSKEAGKVLKIAREHLGNDKVVKAPTFWANVTRRFRKKQKKS
ncbi:DUF956 family protein [Pseudolactococcus insecticola]|uniref:PTS mannose transporter accessory protein ManO n=1 Tax=Pseudolactococcus insecticola TaxID=2709158 RepID=A0A6A0B5E2_9LACT|nr:DUF956 family protein [Lactococcus insecticola]GFH39751.1 PTS mannose transporter accessory protein ManO [Lactococcus insecticola]